MARMIVRPSAFAVAAAAAAVSYGALSALEPESLRVDPWLASFRVADLRAQPITSYDDVEARYGLIAPRESLDAPEFRATRIWSYEVEGAAVQVIRWSADPPFPEETGTERDRSGASYKFYRKIVGRTECLLYPPRRARAERGVSRETALKILKAFEAAGP